MQAGSMLFVFNPKAGQEGIRINLFAVIQRFTQNGFLVTAYPTQGRRDAYRVILEQGERYDCVVCAGGDGTLNESIDAMMHLDRRPVLGYIPTGTTNDFATTLHLPKDPLLAADAICAGMPYAVDVGSFAEEHFSYVAAFGLFTDVPYDTPQDRKNLLGHAAYMLEGVKRLASITSHHCRLETAEGIIEGDFTFGMVSNSSSIGGFQIPSEQEPELDDGLFEVVLLKKIRRFAQLQEVIGILLGNGKRSDSLLTLRTSAIRVCSDTDLKWTLDGEFGGCTRDVQIQNCRRAIKILVPAKEDLMPAYLE